MYKYGSSKSSNNNRLHVALAKAKKWEEVELTVRATIAQAGETNNCADYVCKRLRQAFYAASDAYTEEAHSNDILKIQKITKAHQTDREKLLIKLASAYTEIYKLNLAR